MEILEKIFGGPSRVKLMRLFLFNPKSIFSNEEISERSRVDATHMRRDLNFLHKVGLIKKRTNGGRPNWYLNDRFPYLAEFQRLLLQTSLITPQAIIKKISKFGRPKMLILSGLFKERWDETNLDMLIVSDRPKKSIVDNVMASIEAEIGKEIRYAVLDTDDFKYRLSIGDKLVRDVLDYPHEIVLDRLSLL
jgi:predicted transcriptional regulator